MSPYPITEALDREKRRYVRYELLDYAVLEPDASDANVSVVVTDIGLGGLQVRAKNELAKGTGLTVRISMADAPNGPAGSEEHRLPGEVRHAAPLPKTDLWAIGVRFTPRTHEERIAVAEFVHSVFRRQAESLAG